MFNIIKLNFEKNDLLPVMDSNTLDFHYGKHHQTYCDNLNKFIENTKYEKINSLSEIIKEALNETDLKLKNSIINNAGGVFNHDLFWHNISPIKDCKKPSDNFLKVIQRDFLSFEKLLETLHSQALTQFGSGWAFLCKDEDGKLIVHQSQNQLNCYSLNMKGLTPILAIDVWEHAYYLQYQNRRGEFLTKLFEIINWKSVEELYNK